MYINYIFLTFKEWQDELSFQEGQTQLSVK